jgi:hypothetical protein
MKPKPHGHHGKSNPDCTGKNVNTITNNPTNTNTFNPTINVNPIFSLLPSNGNGENGGNVTVTSGPIFRNIGTDFIEVAILNVTNSSQTVTVSIRNWQNTCDPEEFPKFAYLCGEILNDPEEGDVTILNGVLFPPPSGFLPFLTPFTFAIPARQLLIVRAFPTDPIVPPQTYYDVQVTYPTDPVIPGNPFLPTDPIRVNTWGISSLGTIQEGNTILHHLFTRLLPVDPI